MARASQVEVEESCYCGFVIGQELATVCVVAITRVCYTFDLEERQLGGKRCWCAIFVVYLVGIRRSCLRGETVTHVRHFEERYELTLPDRNAGRAYARRIITIQSFDLSG